MKLRQARKIYYAACEAEDKYIKERVPDPNWYFGDNPVVFAKILATTPYKFHQLQKAITVINKHNH